MDVEHYTICKHMGWDLKLQFQVGVFLLGFVSIIHLSYKDRVECKTCSSAATELLVVREVENMYDVLFLRTVLESGVRMLILSPTCSSIALSCTRGPANYGISASDHHLIQTMGKFTAAGVFVCGVTGCAPAHAGQSSHPSKCKEQKP
eukprot:1140350-Pelagomonas_calceolata.AAC.4